MNTERLRGGLLADLSEKLQEKRATESLERLEEQARSDIAVAILDPYRQLVVTYYNLISVLYDYHLIERNGRGVRRTQIGRAGALEALEALET